LAVLPAFLLSSTGPYWLAILVPSVFFWLWNPHLFGGSIRIPARTFVLFFVCVVLTVIWLSQAGISDCNIGVLDLLTSPAPSTGF
jgi:hypothetical protein